MHELMGFSVNTPITPLSFLNPFVSSFLPQKTSKVYACFSFLHPLCWHVRIWKLTLKDQFWLGSASNTDTKGALFASRSKCRWRQSSSGRVPIRHVYRKHHVPQGVLKICALKYYCIRHCNYLVTRWGIIFNGFPFENPANVNRM